MQHENIRHCFNIVLKSKWFNSILIFLALTGIFCSTSVFAEDLLAGIKEPLRENFGSGSYIVKIIYLICILSSAYAYVETHNIKLAGKILVVSLFITFALSHWVFA